MFFVAIIRNNFPLIGKGLTLVNSVIEGKYLERFADAQTAKQVSNMTSLSVKIGCRGCLSVNMIRGSTL